MRAVLDTGPLLAAASRRDLQHDVCARLLARKDLTIIVPLFVIVETAFLIGSRVGPDAESRFLVRAGGLDLDYPYPDDWPRIASLVQRYRDFPLGGIDASIVATAERLGSSTILTLDRRHFQAVRPGHVAAFDLLPE